MTGVSGPTFWRPPKTASWPFGSPIIVPYQRAYVMEALAVSVLVDGEKSVVWLLAELRLPFTVRSPPEVRTSPESISDCVLQKMSVPVEFGRTLCALVPVPSDGFQTS